ncbi:hypothetical protein [Paenibacillus thermotolerans]|uniref:hypothetical protein n=1 Tax=Paenibacillus thermotolerans TaxID=3027807 RepID=UPI002368C9AE|nr:MULTISPECIES: hypothetical protein [unclassified Paenibacillus]
MLGQFIYAAFIKIFGALSEVIFNGFIARKLGSEIYGELTFVVSFGSLLFFVLFGGKIKHSVKYTSLGFDLNNFNKKYLFFYAIPTSVLLLGFGYISDDGNIIYIAVFSLLMFLFMDLNAVLYGIEKTIYALLAEYIVFRISILIIVMAGFFIFKKFDLMFILATYFLGFLLSIAFQLAVKKKWKDLKAQNYHKERPVYTELFTFQLIEISSNIYTNIPKVLQYIFFGAIQAGYLNIALLVRQMLFFFAGPTNKLFFSHFVKYSSIGDNQKLSETYKNATRWQMFLIMPAFLMIVSYPEIVILIFGEDYINASIVIVITAIATFFDVVAGPNSNFLQMVKKEKLEFKNLIFSLFLFLIMTLLLHSLNAGALILPITLLITTISVNALRLLQIKKHFNFYPYSFKELLYILFWSIALFLVYQIVYLLVIAVFIKYLLIMLIAGVSIVLQFVFSPNMTDKNYMLSRLNKVRRIFLSSRVKANL